MIQKVRIQNFKSIHDLELDLGRINVFIGENGCGKSNILEGVAFGWSFQKWKNFSNEDLISLGIRPAKPSLIRNNSLGSKRYPYIKFNFLPLPDLIFSSIGDIASMRFSPGELIYSSEKTDNRSNSWLNETVNAIIDYAGGKVKEISTKALNEGFTKEVEKSAQRIENILTDLLNLGSQSKYDSLPIYSPEVLVLRGLSTESNKEPLGLFGEKLDYFMASLNNEELTELKSYFFLISWLSDINLDVTENLKLKGFKPRSSNSNLYFSDKFMKREDNYLSSENSNEGVLFVLFYLSLFLTDRTPPIFAIDNIEKSLNPHLCRKLVETLCKMAKDKNKQALITTHNPAILDGLNLNDPDVRLFVVERNQHGHTTARRIEHKPQPPGMSYKLSELWMRGILGGIPDNF